MIDVGGERGARARKTEMQREKDGVRERPRARDRERERERETEAWRFWAHAYYRKRLGSRRRSAGWGCDEWTHCKKMIQNK